MSGVTRRREVSEPGAIRVVTSDLWLSDRAHAAGASVEPSAPFRALIEERGQATVVASRESTP